MLLQCYHLRYLTVVGCTGNIEFKTAAPANRTKVRFDSLVHSAARLAAGPVLLLKALSCNIAMWGAKIVIPTLLSVLPHRVQPTCIRYFPRRDSQTKIRAPDCFLPAASNFISRWFNQQRAASCNHIREISYLLPTYRLKMLRYINFGADIYYTQTRTCLRPWNFCTRNLDDNAIYLKLATKRRRGVKSKYMQYVGFGSRSIYHGELERSGREGRVVKERSGTWRNTVENLFRLGQNLGLAIW